MSRNRNAPVLRTSNDAIRLLTRLGAPARLIRHLELVGEAGGHVVSELEEMGVPFDRQFVQIGIALHDAGKILHPEELGEAGDLHEAAGEKLLLRHGAERKFTRCCRSHAQYASMEICFEELLIALADKLWKGKREPDLELRVIDEVAKRLESDRWDFFEALDRCFEDVASAGRARLARSI